jgi:aryl-phospho-beta-D-glucosidase BglC (GH1 family)
MRKTLGLIIVLGLAASPALAQKVTIDYAHDYDFSKDETFQYVDTEESNAANPMMHDRIESMIKQKLKEGGATEVTENPDLFITYHITTEEQTSYTTSTFGYGGYYGGWGGYGRYGYGGYGPGMASSTTTARNYTEGTLIIDAYDGVEKKMIWRATGTVTVKEQPEKQIKQVEKILTKIGARWEKILAQQGK